MMPLHAPLLYVLILLIVGLPVVVAILPGGRRQMAELWLPLAFAMGWGIHAFLVTGCLALFGSLPSWLLLPVLAVAVASLFLQKGRLGEVLGGFTLHRIPVRGAPLYVLLLVLIAARFILLGADALSQPLFTWDGRMIWNLKAILLFHEGAIHTPAFIDPTRIHFHRDYPLMLPVAYLGVYQLAGGVEERMVRFLLVLFMGFFSLSLYGFLRRRGTPIVALLAALVAVSVAFRHDYGEHDGTTLLTGVADHPLAFLVLLAFGCLQRGWQGGGWRWFLLGGVYAGFTVLLKAEGVIVLAMVGGMAVLALLLQRSWRRPRRLLHPLLAMAAAVAVGLPWFLLKGGLPNYYDESYGSAIASVDWDLAFERVPLLVQLFTAEFLHDRRWGILWIVYAVVVLASIPLCWRRPRRLLLHGVIIAWVVGYLFVYMISPLDLGYHVQTSLPRLLTHFHGLVLLQVGWFLGMWLRWLAGRKQKSSPTGALLPAGD